MALTQAQARQALQFIRNGSLKDLHDVLSAFVEGDFNAVAGVTASAAELNIMDGVTATAAEINMAADISANSEVVTTTNVIAAAEAGTTYFLDAAAGFVSTLPAPALGMQFKFVVKTAPTGGAYTVVTNSSSNIIKGGLNESATSTGPVDTDADTITFAANVALPGDWVNVMSDGTNWYLVGGNAAADNGITLTTAS